MHRCVTQIDGCMIVSVYCLDAFDGKFIDRFIKRPRPLGEKVSFFFIF